MITTATVPSSSVLEERIYKAAATRRRNTDAQNMRIRARFNQLYNQQRLRIDDVIKTIAEEFCLSVATVEKKLKG